MLRTKKNDLFNTTYMILIWIIENELNQRNFVDDIFYISVLGEIQSFFLSNVRNNYH